MEIEGIKNIIQEPAHGSKFYTLDTLRQLVSRLAEIREQLEIREDTDSEVAIAIIQNYVKYNVSLRNSYFDAFCEKCDTFDKNELVYRTAYGALVKGETMCAGCAEAVRILLEMYGIKGLHCYLNYLEVIRDYYIMLLLLNMKKMEKDSMLY